MKKIILIFLSLVIFAPIVNAQQSSADAEVTALRMALEQALRENISLRADLEAARAEIDRIRGGASAPLSMMMAVPVVAAVRTHTVSPGETLGGIAARYYGSVSSYHRIHEANRDSIADPNVISVGQVLRIP